MKKIDLLIVVGLLAGCSSLVRQPFSTTAEYERDIHLKITAMDSAGKTIWKGEQDGVAAVPRASAYHIEGSAKGDFDYLIWETCGRQKHLERQGDDFEIDFIPDPVERLCGDILEIKGYEEKKGRNTGAMMIIGDIARFQLPAELHCNGEKVLSGGTTACQLKQGLKMSISFASPTFVRSEDVKDLTGADRSCGLDGMADQKDYLIVMPAKRCSYVFGEAVPPYRRHRLLVIPYSDVVITREGS